MLSRKTQSRPDFVNDASRASGPLAHPEVNEASYSKRDPQPLEPTVGPRDYDDNSHLPCIGNSKIRLCKKRGRFARHPWNYTGPTPGEDHRCRSPRRPPFPHKATARFEQRKTQNACFP